MALFFDFCLLGELLAWKSAIMTILNEFPALALKLVYVQNFSQIKNGSIFMINRANVQKY